MVAQLEQTHALSQAKAPQLASDCVLLQAGGDGFSRHVRDRFPVTAVCGSSFSAREHIFYVCFTIKQFFSKIKLWLAHCAGHEGKEEVRYHEKP